MKRALSKLAKGLEETEPVEKLDKLGFFSKLITPVTILILVLLFKPTVNDLLRQASEVSVLGASFKFESNGTDIELSALELYYLIHAFKLEGEPLPKAYLGEDELAAIYLLKVKGLLETIEDEQDGIDLIGFKLTEAGETLRQQLNLN